jgi:hypothetical protein
MSNFGNSPENIVKVYNVAIQYYRTSDIETRTQSGLLNRFLEHDMKFTYPQDRGNFMAKNIHDFIIGINTKPENRTKDETKWALLKIINDTFKRYLSTKDDFDINGLKRCIEIDTGSNKDIYESSVKIKESGCTVMGGKKKLRKSKSKKSRKNRKSRRKLR